eukprot:Nitzschia sp. Nitz4//scaffold9_size221794//170423//171979//NITZ4_001371-RA/size221794-processed-gene-0.343-mRNA-1//-1//CDS//3329561076//2446//frame0
MGHSHSHDHDHGHHHDHFESGATDSFRISKRMGLLGIFSLVSGMLVPRKILSAKHWMALVISGFTLISAPQIREGFQDFSYKLRGLTSVIRRHSGGTSIDEPVPTISKSVDSRDADRVTWLGVIVNLVLSIGKFVIGVGQNSSALVADAGHSLSDLISDFITLWSVQLARLPADDDHPYGHYKFEALGSLFLSMTLLATGLSIGTMAAKQLWRVVTAGRHLAGDSVPVVLPGPLALVMALVSICSKEWLFRITRAVALRIHSPVVMANAWHHRSDAYSSVLALFSIAWAMSGFATADAAAGIFVAAMICYTGGEILAESIHQLSDSAHEKIQAKLKDFVSDFAKRDDDILGATRIRARAVGSSIFVDVALETPPYLSTTATRTVEQRVRSQILKNVFPNSADRVDMTIHAGPTLQVCPLLGSEGSTPENSASGIENLVHEQGQLLRTDDTPYIIKDVKVHYTYGAASRVEVTIERRSDMKDTTLVDLEEAAANLKGVLELLNEIQTAEILLSISQPSR